MSSKILYLKDTKIEGIGDASLKKLLSGDITTVNQLAVLTTLELIEYTGLGAATAEKAIKNAIDLMGGGFISADKIYENREPETMHSTGSKRLDDALQGGLRGGAITMMSGEIGTLKSQLGKTAAVICAANHGTVLVIDTEGIWKEGTDRLYQIAETRGYDPSIVENIIIAQSFNKDHFLRLVDMLLSLVKEKNAKMIIIDSIISHWREEFTGRGTLAERQQTLGAAIGRIKRTCEAYRIPVLFTNQVQAVVDNPYGPKLKPAGGHVLGHAVTYSLLSYKGSKVKGDTMDYQSAVVHSYDTASIPPFKVRILCTEAGVVDDDGSYPEQQSLEEVLDE